MDDLPELIEKNRTTNPFFSKIALARVINSVHGGQVIAAWEVDQLDETWQDAFRTLVFDGEAYRRQAAALKAVKDKWLNSHPTYRKH